MLFEFFANLFDNFSYVVDIRIIADANIKLCDDLITTKILDRPHVAEWDRKYHAPRVAQLNRT